MEKHEEIPRYKDSVWFKKKGGGATPFLLETEASKRGR